MSTNAALEALIPPPNKAEEKKRLIRLLDKCKSLVVGDRVNTAGAEVEVLESDARQLCDGGLAEPVGNVISWFTSNVKSLFVPAVNPEDDLSKPSHSRPYKVRVVEGRKTTIGAWEDGKWQNVESRTAGRTVFKAGRSYGGGSVIYLSEGDARIHFQAGNVALLDPPGLPGHNPPAEKAPEPFSINPRGVGAITNPNSR